MCGCHFIKQTIVLVLKFFKNLWTYSVEKINTKINDSELSFSKAAILTGNNDNELLIGENEIECLSKTVCIKVSRSK